MSGIMALLSLDGRPVPLDIARRQLSSIAYLGDRGPALWTGDGVALGHVTFPTTPEAEREALPGAGASGRYWMTWDGRLDNRSELAQELGISQAGLASRSDADLVLAAYQQWGDASVSHFVGEWAMVIWDAKRHRLFCSRDPIGARQLYFTRTSRLLAVGSDPRQFIVSCVCSAEPDWPFIQRLLAEAVQPPNVTYFRDIQSLEGGQNLVVINGELSLHNFWTDSCGPIDRRRDVNSYADEFEHLFGQATAACLRTNRKVGVQLSGGLDSSYVTAIAAQEAEIDAITGYAPGTRWMDEREHATVVAQHCRVPHEMVDVSDCWGLSSRWIPDEALDTPGIPPQGASHVKLAATAAERGIGILLTGEGADEWMTGSPGISRTLVESGLATGWEALRWRAQHGGARRVARDLYRGFVPPVLRSFGRWATRRDAPLTVGGLVPWQPAWTSRMTWDDVPASPRRERYARDWRLYRMASFAHTPWRQRHALAPHRIEVRSPFNDLRIIEMLGRTPERVKFHGGQPKGLLRLVEARHLPPSIPAREDWGLYDELLGTVMVENEAPRINASMAALRDVPGLDRESLDRLCQGSHEAFSVFTWWKWSALTAGSWLLHQRNTPFTKDELGLTHIVQREEVIHETAI